ncbi:MAG: TIGR02450 family Trp-rich protein [Proteobacteria bacterium]|nr:TIGR02450 family Trp-rich protein [Pseudomonadota bacterium]
MKSLNKSAVNKINPDKLMLSKWTAVVLQQREKHFLVACVNEDEQGVVITCVVEAVLTHNEYEIAWQELKDSTRWLAGWL